MVEQYSRLSVLEVKCTQSSLHLIDPVEEFRGLRKKNDVWLAGLLENVIVV
jgi:hypothetical protein